MQAVFDNLSKADILLLLPTFATGCVAVGALMGVILTCLFNFVSGWRERKAQERRQIRELSVNAAIEQWKEERKRADERKETDTVKSLRLRIASFIKFSDLISKGKLTAETLSQNISGSDNFIAETEKLIAAAKQQG